MKEPGLKIVVIAWTQVSRRSQELARELDAIYYRLDRVDRPKWKIIYCLFRNFIKTFIWLGYHRPDVVITFHAHPFITLSAFMYAWIFRKKVIPDIHTAGFLDYDYFPADLLSHLLWNHAHRILLHNSEAGKYMAEKYPDLSGKIVILEDPIPQIEVAAQTRDTDKLMCTFICRFSNDEPFREFLEAAKLIPEIDFYITGNVEKIPSLKQEYNQTNIHFTGFLSDSDYFKQLANSDLLIALTTRPYTLMSAGYEALALGKPLIVTDSEALRQYFGDIPIFCANNRYSIYDSVLLAIDNLYELSENIGHLKMNKKHEWRKQINKLYL